MTSTNKWCTISTVMPSCCALKNKTIKHNANKSTIATENQKSHGQKCNREQSLISRWDTCQRFVSSERLSLRKCSLNCPDLESASLDMCVYTASSQFVSQTSTLYKLNNILTFLSWANLMQNTRDFIPPTPPPFLIVLQPKGGNGWGCRILWLRGWQI